MDLEYISYKKENTIAKITLNRPEVLNALNLEMVDEFLKALRTAEFDREVRVIVITGAGKAFCSGADIHELQEEIDPTQPTLFRHLLRGTFQTLLSLSKIEKPVISSINGIAAGAGLNLALASDLRIASDKARFSSMFVRRGLVPDVGGLYFLPRLVGMAKAKEMCFFGDIIYAEEALRIGLINKLVTHDELEDTTIEWAERLATGAPISLGVTKSILNRSFESNLEDLLEYEAYAHALCASTKDSIEGITSFIERREPLFKGE